MLVVRSELSAATSAFVRSAPAESRAAALAAVRPEACETLELLRTQPRTSKRLPAGDLAAFYSCLDAASVRLAATADGRIAAHRACQDRLSELGVTRLPRRAQTTEAQAPSVVFASCDLSDSGFIDQLIGGDPSAWTAAHTHVGELDPAQALVVASSVLGHLPVTLPSPVVADLIARIAALVIDADGMLPELLVLRHPEIAAAALAACRVLPSPLVCAHALELLSQYGPAEAFSELPGVAAQTVPALVAAAPVEWVAELSSLLDAGAIDALPAVVLADAAGVNLASSWVELLRDELSAPDLFELMVALRSDEARSLVAAAALDSQTMEAFDLSQVLSNPSCRMVLSEVALSSPRRSRWALLATPVAAWSSVLTADRVASMVAQASNIDDRILPAVLSQLPLPGVVLAAVADLPRRAASGHIVAAGVFAQLLAEEFGADATRWGLAWQLASEWAGSSAQLCAAVNAAVKS